MKLSSVYLYEQLEKKYQINGHAGLSEMDGYLRPFLYEGSGGGAVRPGHVCVAPSAITVKRGGEAGENRRPGGRLRRVEECFWIFGRDAGGDGAGEASPDCGVYISVSLPEGGSLAELLNDVQELFNRCDEWNEMVNTLMAAHAGLDKILEETSSFLENPMMVMGLDFSLTAEAGMNQLPGRARLFTEDGVNMEYMNALLQDEAYQNLIHAKETAWFPPFISGCRSLNRNLYVEGQATHRLVLTEWQTPLTGGCVCILETLAGRLEYLLAQESSASITGDLEQIFEKILSDRTADYLQISRQLSALGWSSSHAYFCLILQLTYLDQKQLSTKAICRYIKKQFADSISFLYQEEIVAFFDLDRLGKTKDEVAAKLVYFIRDSYLKAGYSRTMQGHMNLRRQYVQARIALDVGSRKRPYLWIHHFNQVALAYIMEQTTRRLPGNMLCHEGLLRLKEQDEKNHTEYVRTLRAYLNQHLSATQAANELFIHRSTFLYRLGRIREILQSELEDPEELFYLELSLRLLDQEGYHSNETEVR